LALNVTLGDGGIAFSQSLNPLSQQRGMLASVSTSWLSCTSMEASLGSDGFSSPKVVVNDALRHH